MTTIKQIEANRLNALRSTGPTTEQGKKRSRCNAVRHGLTAETVIVELEDVEDYRKFEAAITADYDVETAVERELVLRLASLLWRLRRATALETRIFDLEAVYSDRFSGESQGLAAFDGVRETESGALEHGMTGRERRGHDDLTRSFMQLMNLPNFALDRLNRYELNLWRQASQIILMLSLKSHHRRRSHSRTFSPG